MIAISKVNHSELKRPVCYRQQSFGSLAVMEVSELLKQIFVILKYFYKYAF